VGAGALFAGTALVVGIVVPLAADEVRFQLIFHPDASEAFQRGVTFVSSLAAVGARAGLWALVGHAALLLSRSPRRG
jgi:hypothetical protein